ncbi:MAG: thrombospondin type 3 repeat-containing protein [Desulfuromonadales bacterium]
MKYALTNSLKLRADIGYALAFDPGINGDLEYTLGLNYHFGQPRPIAPPPPADADHDGVPDRKDKCPDTPSGLTVDQFGCPPDTDGDGVPDGLDECPESPPGAAIDSAGCNPDSDRDGVPDDKDICPGTPAGIKVDEQGCVAPKDAALF